LSFTVPPEVMRVEREKSIKLIAHKLRVPGFRKGKTPVAALERAHGRTIDQETIQRVVDEAYRSALAEHALQPISEGELDGVEHRPGGAFAFRISFDVRPVIRLARLGGFVVERPSARIEPADVDQALKRLREENGIWRPPDDDGPPRDGDLVTVQIVPIGEAAAEHGVGLPWARRLRLRQDTDHRGRYQFVLGEGDAVPDLERAVRSLLAGQTGDFWVLDDSTDAGRSGSGIRLRLTLEDRRMRELPELDDAFARSLGDFADLADLRSRIAADLEAEAGARGEAALRDRLLEQLLDANPFDAPQSMVGPGRHSEAAVKRALLIDAIAEAKALAATSDDLEAHIEEIAALGGATPIQVRDRLARSNQLLALEDDITERKVFEFLFSQSRVHDPG
jgi:trigger factor